MKDVSVKNIAIQPGTGFTTKPGVDAEQRTPGLSESKAANLERDP